MDDLNKLIDEASAIAGSRYKLAELLGVKPPTVYGWESGKPCPAADVALMAHIAGFNASEWLARATVKKYEGTLKGEQLKRALGKASAVTIAALGSSGASAASIWSYGIPDSVTGWLVACSTMYRTVKFQTHDFSRP